MKINSSNYKDYKKVLKILWVNLWVGIDENSPLSPIRFLDELEKQNMALAITGLKQALGDMMSMTLDGNELEFDKINKSLEKENLPNLSTLIQEFKNVTKKVLRRKRILNDTEYYLVKNLLLDAEYDGETSEVEMLFEICNDYERQIKSK